MKYNFKNNTVKFRTKEIIDSRSKAMKDLQKRITNIRKLEKRGYTSSYVSAKIKDTRKKHVAAVKQAMTKNRVNYLIKMEEKMVMRISSRQPALRSYTSDYLMSMKLTPANMRKLAVYEKDPTKLMKHITWKLSREQDMNIENQKELENAAESAMAYDALVYAEHREGIMEFNENPNGPYTTATRKWLKEVDPQALKQERRLKKTKTDQLNKTSTLKNKALLDSILKKAGKNKTMDLIKIISKSIK